MKIFMSVAVGIVVFAAIMSIAWMFQVPTEDDENGTRLPEADDWVLASVLGALVGAINYFVPSFTGSLSALAPISLSIMIGFYVFLMVWWYKEGSSWTEMIPFAVMAVVVFFTTKACSLMTCAMLPNMFVASLVAILPIEVFILTIGFMVTSLLYYRYQELGKGEVNRILAIVSGIATAVIMVVLLIILVRWKDASMPVQGADADVAYEDDASYEDDSDYDGVVLDDDVSSEMSTASPSWYKFYNLDLQMDADPQNDFNFGVNPHADGLVASDYDKDFRDRMSKDPALTAADVAWLDAIVGTRYLGEFYESCKGDWAKTINASKEAWLADQGSFYQTLNAYFAFLDTANSVTLEYQTTGLDDQMYMNPKTVDSIPDVIVMTTTDHSGFFLTYTFVIKGNEFKVAYRIDCGYQPTNVQKVMNITPDDTPRNDPVPTSKTDSKPDPTPDPKPDPTPDPKPDPTPDPKPDPTPEPTPTPTPTPEPTPTPTPTPEPTPTPKKDPSKSPKTNVEPNDDPGPGPSTNTGAGSTTSSADQPTNSNHMTDNQYKEAVNDLKEVNQNQKTGSDSSKPSTPAPTPDTHVDNNGDKGNGGKPANDPTPVSAPAKEASSGKEISNADSPAGEWEGPAD